MEKNGGGKCLWQMLGCLILSHMGLNTFRTQRDSTNKQHLLSHKSAPQLLDRQRFLFSFLCSGYFEMDPRRALPVPPEADCALPSASCWLSGPNEPAGACGQSFFQSFPSCHPLHSMVKLPRPAGGAGSLQDALDPDQVLMSGSSCWLTHQRRAIGDRDGEHGGFKGSFHKNRGAIICTVFGLDVFMYAHLRTRSDPRPLTFRCPHS